MVSEWLQLGHHGITDATVMANQLLDGSPIDRNILMAMIAIGVIVLSTRRKRVQTLVGANAAILVFFLYCAASTLWSDYPLVAFKRWIKAFGDLVMVLIVLTDADPAAAVKQVLARMGFLLMPSSILLIKYYPELGRGYENLTWRPVVTGVTTNKNLLGMICLLSGLASSWRLLQLFRTGDGTRGQAIAHATVLLMALGLLGQANSMTAFSCFLMAMAVMLATSFRAVRSGRAVHMVVASVVTIALVAILLDVGQRMLQTLGRDPTLTGRTQLWSVALQYAGDPLFGTGFESFWLGERLQRMWNIYWWHPNEAHNGYLEVFLNLGVLGVALLVVVLAAGYHNVVRALRRDPQGGVFKVAYFAATIAYNFTEATMRTFQPGWVIFLLTIFAVPDGVPRTSTRRLPTTPCPPRAPIRVRPATLHVRSRSQQLNRIG
jgi:hypothetical protein